MPHMQHAIIDIPAKHTSEHLAARHRGHPLKLMTWHSWTLAFHCFCVAPVEPRSKLTLEAPSPQTQLSSGLTKENDEHTLEYEL